MEYLQAALGESLAQPHLGSFLQEGARSTRRGLAQLQIGNSYFGEALDTLELMRLKGDDEGVDSFREVSKRLAALRDSDVAYPVKGQLRANGSWSIRLFKNSFYLSDLAGVVEELKLRCQRSYIFFDFDPEVQYSVSDNAGECTLEILGDAGTTFTLVQAQ